MASTLYNNGYDEHLVKSITGYRSDSVRKYQVINFENRKKASKLIVSKPRGNSTLSILLYIWIKLQINGHEIV